MDEVFPNIDLPKIALVRQSLFDDPMGRIGPEVSRAFSGFDFSAVSKGRSVAVAVGSRGIHRIDRVVFHCLRELEKRGLSPYIVPAMGSHGGGNAKGQAEVLERLGITRSSMGVPVRSETTVRKAAELPGVGSILLAESALEADHILVINRIKPHTKFKAPIESGLCKMLTIGLGKDYGASLFHRWAVHHSFGIIEKAAELLLKKCRVLMGLALMEDGFGRLSRMEAVSPDQWIEKEKKWLAWACEKMPRIPYEKVDVLVVDEIGKNISGIGMDSNVTGRHRDLTGDFSGPPHVKRIFVRDLSPESDGNANGIGLADVTTDRVPAAMDREKTVINAVTAISPEKAAIPIHFSSDAECLDVCVRTSGRLPEEATMVRIRNTSDLSVFYVSETLAAETDENPAVERITPWQPFSFDENGNLPPFSDEYGKR